MRLTLDNYQQVNFSKKIVALYKQTHLFILARTGAKNQYEFVSMMNEINAHEIIRHDVYYSRNFMQSLKMALEANEIIYTANSYRELYEYIQKHPPVLKVVAENS